MYNWVKEHDLLELKKNIGKYLGSYTEFSPEDSEAVGNSFCSCCGKIVKILGLKKEKVDILLSQLRGETEIPPSFKHIWFHCRCGECGSDLFMMRR